MLILTKLNLHPKGRFGHSHGSTSHPFNNTPVGIFLHNNGHYMEEFLLDIQGNNHHVCHSVT